jgi:large-conductance mechanosensitive channel
MQRLEENRKNDADETAEGPSEVDLLTEIRDELRKSA